MLTETPISFVFIVRSPATELLIVINTMASQMDSTEAVARLGLLLFLDVDSFNASPEEVPGLFMTTPIIQDSRRRWETTQETNK